ncbi:MAG: hypothetical protein HY855_14740 [Burkholderiales bacterium]|nr:hypothetical protein [Burkholderiales bacterium]
MSLKFVSLLAAGVLSSAPALAGFVGHTVTADYHWSTLGSVLWSSGQGVAGAGVEFNNIGGFGVGVSPAVDFADTNITVTYPAGFTLAGNGTFDGWVFTDQSSADIVGVTLSGTNLAGLTSASLSFDANHVYLNTLGLGSWGPQTFISVDVQFANAVPEPGALGLAAVALMLAGAAAARRQRG